MPVELAMAALAAKMINDSVGAVDKVYNWVKSREGQRPASLALKSDETEKVLKYVATDTMKTDRVVMTFEELAERIDREDLDHIRGFDARMKTAMKHWNALNASLPGLSVDERVRIETRMDDIRERDICHSLNQIVEFIEKLNIDLYDHYRSVRNIC